MSTVAGFAADLRATSRRLVRSVPAVLDASFHPFRTVREGTRLVQDILTPERGESAPPPTEAAAPADTRTTRDTPDQHDTRATRDTPTRHDTPATRDTSPTRDTTATRGAAATAPASETTPADGLADDRPVQSRGPAPHVPPAIAAEVERDYGDEIPGITPGE